MIACTGTRVPLHAPLPAKGAGVTLNIGAVGPQALVLVGQDNHGDVTYPVESVRVRRQRRNVGKGGFDEILWRAAAAHAVMLRRASFDVY
jgi:hypothetical protein